MSILIVTQMSLYTCTNGIKSSWFIFLPTLLSQIDIELKYASSSGSGMFSMFRNSSWTSHLYKIFRLHFVQFRVDFFFCWSIKSLTCCLSTLIPSALYSCGIMSLTSAFCSSLAISSPAIFIYQMTNDAINLRIYCTIIFHWN
jgi:hypothetical protein